MEQDFEANNPQGALRHFKNKVKYSTGPMEVDYALKNGKKVGKDIRIIDVRASKDYEKGHIPGAISLPEDKWPSCQGLSHDHLNLLYCYSSVCHLAARAAVDFATAGFPVMEIDGGFTAWEEHGLNIERKNEAQDGRPGLKSERDTSKKDDLQSADSVAE